MDSRHIAILDFGSQYMHLISRRVRQLGVRSKIYPTTVSASELSEAYGVIISGGPNSVNDEKLGYDPALFDLNVPILGLCYGHQLMAHHLGGTVTAQHNREYGLASLEASASPLFDGVAERSQVWMSHWDSVTEVPEGFEVIGCTSDCPVAAMANEKTRRYGLQFHPEVHHSESGYQILENFVLKICGAVPNWSMAEYLKGLKSRLALEIGDRNVFLLVSGGVDSTVAFALLESILGKKRVLGLHIDNGFMRKNESAWVAEQLAAAGFDDLKVIDSSDAFLEATSGLTDPEAKRHAIGRVFLEAKKEAASSMGLGDDAWMLGQGTIYPDTIESGGTETSVTIKTHHNRVPEIMELIEKGLVVEPLKDLYKDEVRELGRELGLPEHLVDRWPFPGPGLAIRCLCSDGQVEFETPEQELNAVIGQELSKFELSGRVLPVQSVGVQGDSRSYQHPAVIEADLDTDWKTLGQASVALTNHVQGVNRVVAHIGGELDGLQLIAADLNRERLDLLREVEALVSELVREAGLYHEIWQFPVILLPLAREGDQGSIVLRPIESQEAMTVNFYEMDKEILKRMSERLLELPGVSAVFYDISNKPPATIEWE